MLLARSIAILVIILFLSVSFATLTPANGTDTTWQIMTHIDEVLAKDICQKANINTLLLASIQKFGQTYIVDFKLLDTKRDAYLFTAKKQGMGDESIPSLIDELAEGDRTVLVIEDDMNFAEMLYETESANDIFDFVDFNRPCTDINI